MRKFIISFIGVFVAVGAIAAGENVPTSKSYVDSKLAEKQDNIIANDTPMVLINTGTAGEYGTKGIYDANGAYATQTQNLVDAATMNAGVQNAINSEFQCIEWLDPNDHSSDCLLMDVFGQTERRSPNLFDASKITNTSRIVNNGDGSITITTPARDSAASTGQTLAQLAPGLEVGKQYAFALKYSIIVDNSTVSAQPPHLFLRYAPDTTKNTYIHNMGGVITITQVMLDSVFYFSYKSNSTYNVYDIQITEGTTAMPYVPYGNIYIPAGE